MTVFSLFPSYVQLSYHSPQAPHVALIPTLQWRPGGAWGTFDTWDEGTIDADVMIQEYVDAVVLHYANNVQFDFYTIFNFPDEESDPTAVVFNTLGQVGSVSVGTLTWVAVQQTLTWQCAGGFLLRTVFLDSIATSQFAKISALDAGITYPALISAVLASTNGWASRAGTQPLFIKQAAFTLNEKLRREYRLN